MLLTALLPLALLVADYFAVAPAASPIAAVAEVSYAPAAEKLNATWDADILVLSGLERGTRIRVYDVVGHVLADFRSESPEARLRLRQRQLVAVCAGGECVGAH